MGTIGVARCQMVVLFPIVVSFWSLLPSASTTRGDDSLVAKGFSVEHDLDNKNGHAMIRVRNRYLQAKWPPG